MKTKQFFVELAFVYFLCLIKFFKTASAYHRLKDKVFVDNYIRLAEFPDTDSKSNVQKRTSIVDGGVFVPHKSTTIVYKSRLVPVTYGFVIKKETLKENPALYKLGMKLLDKKAEKSEKQIEPKSNCIKGSKLLMRLLHNLTKDINKLENTFLSDAELQNSDHERLIEKTLHENRDVKKPLPQVEHHESGHKGRTEKTLHTQKTAKHFHSKTWTKYLHCIKRNSKKRCSVLLKRKSWNHRNRGIRPKLRSKKNRLKKERRRCKSCGVVRHSQNRRYHHGRRLMQRSRKLQDLYAIF